MFLNSSWSLAKMEKDAHQMGQGPLSCTKMLRTCSFSSYQINASVRSKRRRCTFANATSRGSEDSSSSSESDPETDSGDESSDGSRSIPAPAAVPAPIPIVWAERDCFPHRFGFSGRDGVQVNLDDLTYSMLFLLMTSFNALPMRQTSLLLTTRKTETGSTLLW